MELTPQPRLRAGHDDRSAVTDVLATAYAEGKIDRDEFDERSGQVLTAKYLDELELIVADISPAAIVPVNPVAPANRENATIDRTAKGSPTSIGIFGGFNRAGTWVIAPRHRVFTLFGGGSIDLRDVVFTSDEVTLTIVSVMGGCEIIAPPNARLICDGVGIMGGFDDGAKGAARPADQTGPVIHVRGLAFWGGVGIRRKARKLPDSSLEPPS